MLEPPVVVPAPTGRLTSTRLRLSDAEEQLLFEVGRFLGSLAAKDLAARVEAGSSHSKTTKAARKREATEASTSRWAGTIVRGNDDQWRLARRNQLRHIKSLRHAIATIDARVNLPVAPRPRPGEKRTKRAKGTLVGYRSKQERWAKQQRRQHLAARLARLERDYAAGHVPICRGGVKLAKLRNNLDAAGITEAEWRRRWDAARLHLSANGSHDERCGNLTIRVTGDGTLSLRLPRSLEHRANRPRGVFEFTNKVTFAHLVGDWANQITDGAVAYRIRFEPTRGHGQGAWYLDAAWTDKTNGATAPPDLDDVRSRNVVGCDLNADHLAAWCVDPYGNPVGVPVLH